MNYADDKERIATLTRELELMRERYSKLVDLHGQLQKQNSSLEERILSIVETNSTEKYQLEQELIDNKQQVIHLKDTVNELETEKQRYKDDCNLAVRLLHRHPNEFISATSGHLQEQTKNKNESTLTNQPTPSQHNVLIPTFPPIFVRPLPLVNTNTSPPPVVTETTTISTDNLRLAESLFKSNTVHRYPSTHFICSNCHQTVKCCDVSVQTSPDDHGTISRTRIVSLTASDDGLNSDLTEVSLEPHHGHMTLQEYQMGNTRRPSQDTGLSPSSLPQMHHV